MISRTFQHVPGIGPWREKDLWAKGVCTWDDFFRRARGEVLVSEQADAIAPDYLAAAAEALDRRDLGGLARLLPRREHWRLYAEFGSDVAFFDIEADGDGTPTVATVFDAAGIAVFIRGKNLDELPQALGQRPIWATFNGSSYDIPILQRCFESLSGPLVHLDLKFILGRLRLGGGLKRIEDTLGLARPDHLRGVGGWHAPLLWTAYQTHGDVEALRFLVEYNAYDAINLRTLLDVAYNRIVEGLGFESPRVRVLERGEVLYDLSKLILGLSSGPRDLRALERLKAPGA